MKLPIVILQKSIILDMNHRITYMYINFQPRGFCRSVKTVHTNLLAKNRKLHKFATTNSNFTKKKHDYSSHESLDNVHVYQFSAKSV